MPNVIAIVDDKKIRGQIDTFCRELNSAGIRLRSFPSTKEFEDLYFANKHAPKIHPLQKLVGWEKFAYDQIESILNIPIVTKPTLPSATMKLRVSNKSMLIENIEPLMDANQTLLNKFPEDVQSQMDFFSNCVFPAWKDAWAEFFRKAQSSSALGVFPLKATDTGLGWFKISGQRQGSENIMIQIEEVTDLYRYPVNSELERRKVHAENTKELQLMSEIDLIVFQIDCIDMKVPHWMDKIWKKLKDGGYFPAEKIPRFVLLKYEEDQVHKLDVLHPRLDDLIYLPLDRLIFMQKMEIIFSLPKKTSPSILFSQEANVPIEISKITKLEKLSDLGLAIRNPVRLTPGVLAHFYLQFPNTEITLDIWGKVVHSEPHPEREQEFLVYFAYFGLAKNDATVIKRYLAGLGRYNPFVNSERASFQFNADNESFVEEDRKPRQVVILDLDEDLANQLKINLPKDIDQIKCVADTSFASFSNRFLRNSSSQFANPPVGATEADLFGPSVSFIVNPVNQELNSALLAPADGQLYFGYPAAESFATGLGWQSPFHSVPENVELLTEMMAVAASGKKVHRVLVAATSSGEGKVVRVSAAPTESPELVKIEISPPTIDALKSTQKHERLIGLHVVVVDINLIPGRNVDDFIERLTDRAQQLALIPMGQKPKFILLVDNDQKPDHRSFTNTSIIGLVAKPIEPRQLSFMVATALGTKYSIYSFPNLGWANAKLSVHVAKDVILERLSEFGADIQHARPIAPGTILYLRGGIFENAPNRCLAARFYHCEEHQKEKGVFLCSLTYFGINDGFMKFARKWFRENYALSKQAGSTES